LHGRPSRVCKYFSASIVDKLQKNAGLGLLFFRQPSCILRGDLLPGRPVDRSFAVGCYEDYTQKVNQPLTGFNVIKPSISCSALFMLLYALSLQVSRSSVLIMAP